MAVEEQAVLPEGTYNGCQAAEGVATRLGWSRMSSKEMFEKRPGGLVQGRGHNTCKGPGAGQGMAC